MIPGCRLLYINPMYYPADSLDIVILCETIFDTYNFTRLTDQNLGCPILDTNLLQIIIRPQKQKRIIDDSWGIFKIREHLIGSLDYVPKLVFKFLNVDGIRVDSLVDLGFRAQSQRLNLLRFDQGNFRFYDKSHRPIRSCADFSSLGLSKFAFSVDFYMGMHLEQINTAICFKFFQNSYFERISITKQINSFYKRSLIKFVNDDLNDSSTWDLGVNVYMYEMKEMYGIDIDENLIHPQLFTNTSLFFLIGNINSIQVDLFGKFEYMVMITLSAHECLELLRRRGLDWIRTINSQFNIDIRNKSLLANNSDYFRFISLQITRESLVAGDYQFSLDEDFCLFHEFPFHQLIFVLPMWLQRATHMKYSCTSWWIFQHIPNIYEYLHGSYHGFMGHIIKDMKSINTTACEFAKRLGICKKSDYKTSHNPIAVEFTRLDILMLAELISTIASSLVSLLGIVSNVCIIYTIRSKKNEKMLGEKHYKYMAVTCAANVGVLAIQMLGLLNECYFPFGLYCSYVRAVVFVQYLKIIVGEYFNSFFRLLSNFSYIAFSLNRLNCIGKDHDVITEFVSKISIKNYLTISCLLSCGLSVVKALRFEINKIDNSNLFPLIFDQNNYRHGWRFETKFVVIISFNVVYDILAYLLFVLISFIVDLRLLVKLFQVINEKESKQRLILKQSVKALEKSKKDNDESKRRVLTMVVISCMFNFMTKIPLAISSLNDLRLHFSLDSGFGYLTQINRLEWFDFLYWTKYFCSTSRICLFWQNIGNLLYLLSLSSTAVFLKKFDQNFDMSWKNTFRFGSNSKSTKTNLN